MTQQEFYKYIEDAQQKHLDDMKKNTSDLRKLVEDFRASRGLSESAISEMLYGLSISMANRIRYDY